MSLERYGEKPTESIRPFSREKNARLREIANHRQEKISTESEPEKMPAQPDLQDLQAEMMNVANMKMAIADEARQNKETVIILASVEKLCVIQQSFMQNMLKKFDEMNDNQLKILSLQEQYAKSVKASTIEVTRDIFHLFKDEQTATFREVQKYLYDSCDELERELISCTKNVKSATMAAKNISKEISNSIKRFCTVRTIGDILYYAAPVAVVIDVLLRLLDFI